MKNFTVALLALAFACCQKPVHETRYFISVSSDSLSRSDLYEMQINDTVVTGNIYSNFVRKDTLPVKGFFNKSGKIRWLEYEYPGHEPTSFHYGVLKENGWIVPDLEFPDRNAFYSTIRLRPIDRKTFNTTKAEFFPPVKKVNWVRTVTYDDFIFDVRVNGWSTEDFKGETTFTVKDRKSGTILQRIKTNDFHCNQYVRFGFEDVNFDGMPDLIVPIGAVGNRGTEISSYYLYDKTSNRFVNNENLDWAYSGIDTERDEKNKRIVNISSSGGGIMFTEFQVDGMHVEPTRKVDISYWSDRRYDVEVMVWKTDSFQVIRKKEITPEKFKRNKTFEQLFKI